MEGRGRKETVLAIRCSWETRKRFNVVHARLGFRDREATLSYLLDLAERYALYSR
ncbi:MAG: hypothetical protein LM580_07230 [Thermofilum sp.]|nr:hypothetical protein [Thermofilum sp.]